LGPFDNEKSINQRRSKGNLVNIAVFLQLGYYLTRTKGVHERAQDGLGSLILIREKVMNKKISVFAIAALAGAISQTAMAEVPSFNYVQFDYVLSGDSEVSRGGLSDSLDLQQGFGLQGGFEVGDYVMVLGRHLSLDYDDDQGAGLTGVENTALNDMTFIGVGAHFPLADVVDLYGAVGFSRPTLTSFAGEGFGFEVGARANFDMVTASLWYNMGDTDTDASVGPGSVDIDPELLGLDVAIAFAPDAPELVLGYVDASHEAEVGNTKVDVDYDHFSIGVRKSF
tara:strand:- start:2134 stop:2982 length:849 start_codon:yes stop_codon:yes gene_type:complete